LPVVSEGNISPLHVYDQQPMYFSANTLGWTAFMSCALCSVLFCLVRSVLKFDCRLVTNWTPNKCKAQYASCRHIFKDSSILPVAPLYIHKRVC
jgi:hypothetical protein